jgi:GMP synthase (glutamine-hydrolysing)
MKKAVAIRHVSFEDLGLIESVLEKRGIEVQYVEAATDDLSPARDADLTVFLGGPISVNDREDYPFLNEEVAIAAARMEADKPTLGLCLGGQIMASALGATVKPNTAKEIGWSPLTLTGAGDAFMPELKGVPIMHWHGEAFDLPKGALSLASTDITPHQGFAYKERALGLQCHPEVTARGLAYWFVGYPDEICVTPGVSMAKLRADTEKCAPILAKGGAAFFDRWLASVGL